MIVLYCSYGTYKIFWEWYIPFAAYTVTCVYYVSYSLYSVFVLFHLYIQGVPGGKELTSGECSLGQTIPI